MFIFFFFCRRQRSSNYDTFDDPVETYLENIAEKSGEKSEEKSSSDPYVLIKYILYYQ
jgi:hypothetical protein